MPRDSAPTTPAERTHTPTWWVCCTWYDDKGQLWSHGLDGVDTYQACTTRDEAFRTAQEHRVRDHPAPTWQVDICEGPLGGRRLHTRFDAGVERS